MNNTQDWLELNKDLRMDANSHLFDESRRSFHMSRYDFAMQFCNKKKVLDGACGTGYGTSLISRVAEISIGIDCDKSAIEYANLVYKNKNTEFKTSFVEATEFNDSEFDVVLSFETVEHTLCPNSHIREIERIIKPDGIAVLSVPNNWGLTNHHFWNFDFPMFKSLLEKYFGEIEYFYNNSDHYDGIKGIGPFIDTNNAECIIAVCKKPLKSNYNYNRYNLIMEEVYEGVFMRHTQNIKKKNKLDLLKSFIKEFIS